MLNQIIAQEKRIGGGLHTMKKVTLYHNPS